MTSKTEKNQFVLWLVSHESGTPFMHQLTEKCECQMCEHKRLVGKLTLS
jgi:hypothetical protein